MSESTPVELLHSEYAKLHLLLPSTLTEDQKQSLFYYAADVGSGRSVGEKASRGVLLWIRNLRALDDFVLREGRMPRENRRLPAGSISAEESQLVHRVRAQRRAFAAGRLCSYQERRMLCVPGFSFHPCEDLWRANFVAYDRFVAAHRDVPKLRSKVGSERNLAGWAAKARMAYRAGTLASWKQDALNSLDFWSWGATGRP